MNYVHERHDIGVLRSDGTTKVGLMLARRNEVPVYNVVSRDALAEQRASGTPGYGWFEPGIDLPLIQDDFSGGLSQDVFLSASPNKYQLAHNMDCRFPYMAICGPKATAITRPTTTSASLTDGGLENWTAGNLDSWNDTSAYVIKNTTDQVEGAACAEFDVTVGAETVVSIYQDLTWNNEYRSRVVTATAWLKAGTFSGTGYLRIIIDDGVSTSQTDQTASTTGYKTVTRRLDAAATQLRIKIEYKGNNTVGSSFTDNITIVMPDKKFPKDFATFNQQHFCAEGNVLSELDSNGDELLYVYNFPNDITDLEPFVDGNLYIALGGGNKYWYMQETSVDTCDDRWDEFIDADVTSETDINDKREGAASAKFTIAAGLAANDLIATEAITSTDYSTYTHVTFKIKSSVALAASDLQFLLDNTALCASPLKSLNIPSVEADKWLYVSMSLGDASGLTAIISIGLKYVTDVGACTLRIDDVRMRKFTESTLSDGDCDYFQQNGSTMWKAKRPRELKSVTDPTNAGTWSSATNVDIATYNINALISLENLLYVMKEDRPFYLTAAGAVTVLADDTKSIATSDSGKNSIHWHGELFMPWGDASLLRYDGTDTSWIDPALYGVDIGDIDGQIMGLAGDDQFLYAVVDNGTKVEVLAGEPITGGWKWHGSLTEITLTGCENAFVSNIYKKRLYIASTLASDSLYAIDLYANYGDVINDGNRSYDTSATKDLITPWLYADFKADTKAFIKITLEMKATTSAIYFECHYQILGDTTWTDIGDFKTSPTTTAFIPNDSGGANPKSNAIRFKFVAITNSATTTPVLKSYDCRAVLYATRRRLINCVVRCVDSPLDKEGMEYDITAAYIKTVLEEAEDATWPVTIYDIDSTTKTVKFLPMSSVTVRSEKDREATRREREYELNMVEIPLS